jgi:hypothetical protein
VNRGEAKYVDIVTCVTNLYLLLIGEYKSLLNTNTTTTTTTTNNNNNNNNITKIKMGSSCNENGENKNHQKSNRMDFM